MIVSKSFTLDSSHQLPNHPGKCARLHGHTWTVTIALHGRPNPDTSFVLDYAVLDSVVKPLIDFLDHRHLNFLIVYPSSENLCQFLGRYMERFIDKWFITRVIVQIKETPKTEATWDSAEKMDTDVMMSNAGSHAFRLQVPQEEEEADQPLKIGGAFIMRSELIVLQREFQELIKQTIQTINRIRHANYLAAVAAGKVSSGEQGSIQLNVVSPASVGGEVK